MKPPETRSGGHQPPAGAATAELTQPIKWHGYRRRSRLYRSTSANGTTLKPSAVATVFNVPRLMSTAIVGVVTGERHPGAKIKDSDIPAIRARRANGETLSRIGRDYGITEQRVYQLTKDTP